MSMVSVSPLATNAGHCTLIPDFLTLAECRELIALSERRGYGTASTDYPPSYRNNDRNGIDSTELAVRLGERLRGHAPASLQVDGAEWQFDGINERFRFCRYQAGQRFSIHQDGVHHRGAGCRSQLTLLIYLTDGSAFSGGDTVFYSQGPGGDGAGMHELGRVRPQAGSLLLFDHDIWHAGDEVGAGTKHVLRSDVLYRAAAIDGGAADASIHLGYVWTLSELEGGWSASGGRDATIRIRDGDGRMLRSLHGHEQSVLGLAQLQGRRLASVSRDRTMRLWDWSTGHCETSVVAHEAAVLDVITLPRKRLATCSADGSIKIWKQDGSAVASLAGHQGWVWQLAACGPQHLASASEDGTVRIWDVDTFRCTAVLDSDEPLRTVLASNDTIWTGDIAGRVTCWRREAGEWIRQTPFRAHRAAIRRLRHVGNGLIASCGEDKAMRVWDIDSGAQVFEAWHDNFVTDALRCGDVLIGSSYDGQIRAHKGWLPNTHQAGAAR